MNTKNAVEVRTNDFLNVKWVCPTCSTVNCRDAMPHKGSPSVKCRYCQQRLTRDTVTGIWSTENYVIREGNGFKEVSGEGHTPLEVNCKEVSRTEGWKWRCLCGASNACGLGLNPISPMDGYRDKKHYFHAGPAMKCHLCGLVIIQQSDSSEWEIIQEGRDR